MMRFNNLEIINILYERFYMNDYGILLLDLGEGTVEITSVNYNWIMN